MKIALNNQAEAGRQLVAMNAALQLSAEGAAPEWVQLIPIGAVEGRDGRSWRFDHPEHLLHAFRAAGMDAPVDWEHATELVAPGGGEAPAAGWITAMEVREGSLWGRVDWTPKAAAQIAAREYRYLSPVFWWEKASGQILELVSAALTNRPNLRLAALNRFQLEEPMDLELLQALGLPATASIKDALTAINAMKSASPAVPKALCSALGVADDATVEQAETKAKDMASQAKTAATPQLEKYVPRADYDATLARAANAEKRLAELAAAGRESEIDAEIKAALAAGKIVPATEEFYRAVCRQAGGLEQFRSFVKAAPELGGESGIGGTPKGGGGKLDAAQMAVCSRLGIAPEEYAKNIDKAEKAGEVK